MTTTAAPSDKPTFQIVEGVPFNTFYNADNIRSAINYKPRSDDLFTVTYMKCGTTWIQHILLLIYRHGEPITNQLEFYSASPYLELTGAEAVKNMARPGPIKIHLPFHLAPWNDSAKYIYVARNPRDCCVSYFHHMKSLPVHDFSGTFDEFFELFMSGEVDYGDYFDHLLGWYEQRNRPNVLFITYEEIKENPKESILKIASFIDEDLYAKPLRDDPEKLENVVRYSSFDYMKDKMNKGFKALLSMSKEEVFNSSLPDQMKALIVQIPISGAKPPSPQFIRKGIVGDWRNHFSEEQIRRMNEKFQLRTKGTGIPKLWEKYMQ